MAFLTNFCRTETNEEKRLTNSQPDANRVRLKRPSYHIWNLLRRSFLNHLQYQKSGRGLEFLKNKHFKNNPDLYVPLSPVTCHLSLVTCHLSLVSYSNLLSHCCIECTASLIIFFIFFWRLKVKKACVCI